MNSRNHQSYPLFSLFLRIIDKFVICRADGREQQCGESARSEAGECLQSGQPGPGHAGEAAEDEAGAPRPGGEAAPRPTPASGLSDGREGAGGEDPEQRQQPLQ